MTEDPTNYKALWDQLRRESADMAEAAAREIDNLRRERDVLQPKAHAYDQLSIVLGLLPRSSQGYGVDLAYQLRTKAEMLRSPDQSDDLADME